MTAVSPSPQASMALLRALRHEALDRWNRLADRPDSDLTADELLAIIRYCDTTLDSLRPGRARAPIPESLSPMIDLLRKDVAQRLTYHRS